MYGQAKEILNGKPHLSTLAALMSSQDLRLLDYGHYTSVYRWFTCNGILFNHESPYGEPFVTRKIGSHSDGNG
jgi:hypothetical protein